MIRLDFATGLAEQEALQTLRCGFMVTAGAQKKSSRIVGRRHDEVVADMHARRFFRPWLVRGRIRRASSGHAVTPPEPGHSRTNRTPG
jgi:hypothetical protein